MVANYQMYGVLFCTYRARLNMVPVILANLKQSECLDVTLIFATYCKSVRRLFTKAAFISSGKTESHAQHV
jgi:hypothetical protein